MGDKAAAQQNQDLRITNQDDQEERVVGGGGGSKEVEPGTSQTVEQSNGEAEVREITTPEEVPSEVQGWVERVKRGEEIHLAQPVMHKGETLVDSNNPRNVKVMLPLTQEGVKRGLHHKVYDSFRWLAEFCVRLIKIPGKAIYKK